MDILLIIFIIFEIGTNYCTISLILSISDNYLPFFDLSCNLGKLSMCFSSFQLFVIWTPIGLTKGRHWETSVSKNEKRGIRLLIPFLAALCWDSSRCHVPLLHNCGFWQMVHLYLFKASILTGSNNIFLLCAVSYWDGICFPLLVFFGCLGSLTGFPNTSFKKKSCY